MSYCFNPNCQKPQNEDNNNICSNCSSNLLLKDRYCAIKIIGQGGFGKTYLASDSADSSLCVVKQFSFSSSSTALRLFAEEAQRLKTLGSHPQIPTFVEYVEQENQYFIIQEFIDGTNLEAELRTDGAFDETKIELLLGDILPIIKFVHEQAVIHRDIKPENIIRRNSDRTLVLVDFGASKRATETSLAKTGTTIGSAGYAAPEQTFGKAVFQSDLYSLGVTCVHLLTGLHPFDLVDNASGEWVWRDYLKEPVYAKLGQILDKLLERGTRQRYQSAAEVLQDLQFEIKSKAVQMYEQVSAEQVPVRRFHLGKIAAVGLLVIGGLVAIPVASNIFNHPQIAKVPHEQGSKAQVPNAKPVIPQKPNGQPQESPEDRVTNDKLVLFILVCKATATTMLIYSGLRILQAFNRGEEIMPIMMRTFAAFIFLIVTTVAPSWLGVDIADDKVISPISTNESSNQILPDQQRR